MSLIAALVPLTLSAAVSSEVYGENKAVFYNTSGIPNQEDWDSYQVAQAKSQIKRAPYACNCVLWAQSQGLDVQGYGYAKNYPVNSQVPALYGFVVTYESYAGHVALYYLDGSDLVLDEANYVSCRITSGRRLPVGSPLIKGYIN